MIAWPKSPSSDERTRPKDDNQEIRGSRAGDERLLVATKRWPPLLAKNHRQFCKIALADAKLQRRFDLVETGPGIADNALAVGCHPDDLLRLARWIRFERQDLQALQLARGPTDGLSCHAHPPRDLGCVGVAAIEITQKHEMRCCQVAVTTPRHEVQQAARQPLLATHKQKAELKSLERGGLCAHCKLS